MNAAIYLRVSTEDQQRDGVSLDVQLNRLLAYCQSKGLAVISIIRDVAISGGTPIDKRPGGQELLQLIQKKKVQHVVAMKLDRLFRDCADCLLKCREWDRRGISLHLLDLSVDTSTPMGRMFLTMASGFAELERNLIADRTRNAMRHLKSIGRVFNHVPYGYCKEGQNLLPDPTEQTIIDRIRTMRRAGFKFATIAETLNTEKIPSKTGKRWSSSAIWYVHNRPAL